MTMYYSAAERGFADGDDREAYEKGAGWPPDAVALKYEDYCALLNGQAAGGEIRSGPDGYPVLWKPDAAVLAAEKAAAEKELRLEEAGREIRRLETVAEVDALTAEEQARLTAWKRYLAAVYRLRPEQVAEMARPEAPA